MQALGSPHDAGVVREQSIRVEGNDAEGDEGVDAEVPRNGNVRRVVNLVLRYERRQLPFSGARQTTRLT